MRPQVALQRARPRKHLVTPLMRAVPRPRRRGPDPFRPGGGPAAAGGRQAADARRGGDDDFRHRDRRRRRRGRLVRQRRGPAVAAARPGAAVGELVERRVGLDGRWPRLRERCPGEVRERRGPRARARRLRLRTRLRGRDGPKLGGLGEGRGRLVGGEGGGDSVGGRNGEGRGEIVAVRALRWRRRERRGGAPGVERFGEGDLGRGEPGRRRPSGRGVVHGGVGLTRIGPGAGLQIRRRCWVGRLGGGRAVAVCMKGGNGRGAGRGPVGRVGCLERRLHRDLAVGCGRLVSTNRNGLDERTHRLGLASRPLLQTSVAGWPSTPYRGSWPRRPYRVCSVALRCPHESQRARRAGDEATISRSVDRVS